MSPIEGNQALQLKLNEVLAESQLKNQGFSLRAYSRRLAISPSALSEILNGKRRVSRRMAQRLVDRLCLSPREADQILERFNAISIPDSEMAYTELSSDEFRLISEWYHFAILSLVETKAFNSEPAWIAERLGIKLSEVLGALTRLERLGLIRRGLYGKIRATGKRYVTSDNVRDTGLRKAHSHNLELARRSLEEDPVTARDLTSITMAIDVTKLPAAQKLIRRFQDQMSLLLETSPKTEVYKLCIQLFPLTIRRYGKDEN